MAVDTPDTKPLMRDYYGKFRQRTYILVTCTQTAVVLASLGLMELTGITQLGWGGYALLALVASAVLNTATITLIHIIGRPFHDLVQAIVLVAGEPTAVAPPNPNMHQYDKDGFRDILQTIYELASHRDDDQQTVSTSKPSEQLTGGLDNTTTGVVIMDSDRNIVYHNRPAPVQETTDGGLRLSLIFADSNDDIDTWLNKVAKNKLTAEHQWIRVADKLPGEKDRHLFDITASFHKNSSAETVLTFFDRTALYMPEEDDLDFISFAAHELRGPITVIRGYLDVLQDELEPVLEQDQAELLQRLTVTANRLTSYVNNILNASRYDRRHMKLHLAEETIQHLYDPISDDMQARAQAQNRLLVTDFPKNLPTVAADANAIGEVMSNLIDNAIKYSNEGGLVHVTARTVPGFVEFSVVDRGIGMPSSVLPNLFHKFYRSHRSRETVAGTGIGLYISKAIVSSHGGSITARSVENEGSTFSFTLPIYDTVESKIKSTGDSNVALIEQGSGWIRNHSMYKN
jgi:signal transduction histidine kinase